MFDIFRKKLPHCNDLYGKFFSPWYQEEEKQQMPRPDMYTLDVDEGPPIKLEQLQYLDDEYLAYQKEHLTVTMVDAARQDFRHITNTDQLDLEFLDAVDRYYDRPRIAKLIKESDPADFSNSYLVTVCEFGALLGHLFRQVEGFDWLYSHPYFDSIIVHKESGYAITVFDWAMKKFSEYGVDDGYAEKFKAAIAGVNGEWQDDEAE